MTDNTTEELKGFLAQHETVGKPTLLRVGDVVDRWRVTGFLARGGHAEVYRVERVDAIVSIASLRKIDSSTDAFETNASTVSVAALKILARDDEASRARFEQEVQLLKKHFASSLPYFYGAGKTNGHPYFVTDLLEPIDLSTTDAEVTHYLLAVSTAVAVLHHQGLVHRDIKPANVMRRANGEIVLIDLGLVKDTARSSRPETNVSIIDGKPVAVGTPAYAAPEQILGGEVSTAVDIHALGKLADVCFESHPPKAWLPIIRRATSSIPAQRYATVEDFAKAICRRHWSRWIWSATGAAIIVVTIGVFGKARTPAAPQSQHNAIVAGESVAAASSRPPRDEAALWQSLCRETTANLVAQQLVWERLVTNTVNGISCVSPERAYRTVTNRVMATAIRLEGSTHTFVRPITLNPSREYFISGPGTLDAELLATAPTRIHLDRMNLMNRATNRVAKAGITYVFGRQVYLNFPNQRKEDNRDFRKAIEDFDGGTNEIRFQGPTSIEELNRQRQQELDDEFLKEQQRANSEDVSKLVDAIVSIASDRKVSSSPDAFETNASTEVADFEITQNKRKFPCRFFTPRGKYVVETMKDSIYKKYGIDPYRIPTDAEVELVAFCFDVSEAEARSILAHRRAVDRAEVFPQIGRAVSMRPPRTEETHV